MVLAVTGCGANPSSGAGRVSDSVYVAAMGDLLRLDQSRRSRQLPPWPGPSVGQLPSDSAWKPLRREESLKVVRADSAARAALLASHGVTEAQLEATARALVEDTRRGRALWDSITKRAAAPPTAPAARDTTVTSPRPTS